MALQAQTLYNKALSALNANNARGAKKIALKLTKIDRDNFAGWHLMAAIHGKLGEVGHAEKAFVKAARLAATDLEREQIYEQLGKFLMEHREPGRATKYFTKLQKLAPGRVEVAYFLAESYRLSRNFQPALIEYDKASSLQSIEGDVLIRKADCLQKLGRPNDAIRCLTKASTIRPDNVDVALALVSCYVDINAYDEARALLSRLTDADPRNPRLHYELALLHRNFGNLEESIRCFEKTLALAPDAATVYYNYSRIKRFDADDPVIQDIQNCLMNLPASKETNSQLQSKAELLFALGKIAADSEQHEQAFDYWQKANAFKRRTFEYDIGRDSRRAAAIMKIIDTKLIENLQLEAPEGPTPIFIVGMPRAGSTLCEQILASHADVSALGELTLLPELIGDYETDLKCPYPKLLTRLDRRQLGELRDKYMVSVVGKVSQRYFTDKLPSNFWLIGLIRVLFPDSPIIHTCRDPIDTGFSCYKHLFSGAQKFAYDLVEIRHYIESYRKLMAYWHELLPGYIFDLDYEGLVADPEHAVKSILQFCDLPWQTECLHFYESARAVKSSSAAQVRQPIHSDAVGSWQVYEPYLHDLTDLDRPAPT